MSTLGTFDSFTTARLGIYAAQHGLHITGNNISNINTTGYTRQRVDQVSFKAGSTDRYASWMDNHMGSGVLVSGISQIRDPFLDIRYRTTSTSTYYYDTKLAGLQSIASILDEVGKGDNDGDGLIYAQFQDMLTQLRAFSADPTSANDTLVRNSAAALASLFRTYAAKLDELYANAETDFNNSITKVNEILVNIRDLNESIRDAEIHGDPALELRDERNLQIDELSKYLSIKVEYSYEDVGAGVQVEKLTIKMGNSNPDSSVHTDESTLVDGLYCTQLSVPEFKPLANTYDAEYLKGYSYLKEYSPANLDELQAFLNENGITLEDLIPARDEDGNVIPDVYYVGTNSVEEAVQVDNDNYTIQLSELVDRKGKLWESTTTTWTKVSGAPANAKYAYTVSMEDGHPAEGDKITIQGADPEEYTVGQDGVPTNKQALLKFIADKLNETGRYPDYTVSASGDQLIFTANNPGEVGVDDGAPTADPGFSITVPNDWGASVSGVIETPGAAIPDDAGTTYDEYGNKTTVKYIQSGDEWYKVVIKTEYTRAIALDDNDPDGILQAQRELLTEEGEFSSAWDVAIDENACEKRGIPYYIKSLDLLAQKFAEAYNELNQGYMRNQDGYYVDEDGNLLMLEDINEPMLDEDGNPVMDENNNPVYVSKPVSADGLTEGQLQNLTNNGYTLESWLEENGGVFMGGPLFSNSNAGNNTTDPRINAHNIDISAGWSNGDWGIVPKFEILFDGSVDHTTQNTNADHMVSLLLDKALSYDPRDLAGSDAIGPLLFSGTFNDFLSNMMGVEAQDEDITTVQFSTSSLMLTDLDYSREGVSGVDLNDEAMNMITYQKAMSAAMRLMTVIDEELDRLINNTGVT